MFLAGFLFCTQVGGQYPLHTAVTCLHSSSSVAIVKALLEHGANPNSEEGVQPVKFKDNGLSIQRKGKDEEEGEKLNSGDKESGTLNKVTFLVGAEDSTEHEGDHSEFTSIPQAPAAMSILAGDNLGRSGYTPLHLLCSTETSNTTGTPAAQQQVRLKLQ